MTEFHAASNDPSQGAIQTTPAITRAEAHADHAARARKHASDCVLLAVVTSPELSAELIDRAIEYARHAGGRHPLHRSAS